MSRAARKPLVAVMLALQCLLFTACLGYRDLDHVVFVTSVLVDRDGGNNLILYFETLNSIRSSSKEANQEERIVYKVTVQNTGDALNQLETFTSAPVSMAHNKVVLFTEKYARSGMEDTIDLFDRWQDSSNRTLLAIFLGDPESYVNPNHREETMTGLYLYDMLGNKAAVTTYGVKVNIKEFMNQRYIGDRVNSMTMIDVSKEHFTKGQYYVGGLGLIKEYNLIGTIDREETIYFNLLLDNKVTGNLNTANPQDRTKTVSMLLQKYQYESEPELVSGKLKMHIRIKMNTTISAVQGRLEMNKDVISQMEKETEERIEQNCQKLFERWKERKTDVFDIQEKFARKYPKEADRNIIEDTELDLQVQMNIVGTTTIMDAE
ncbi:Ger(x)C family spore germination protein [Paenibacillus sp. NFR01]|uniref:Ger(x)C family spore germination protein n=1 Tax=Paenibacillus sp. NFR01 TaxID=1566279 RepID=UPI0008B8D669|nr:Ger(x)C family spore germination protein [Paenibacillus sp. NFR01]SES95589.1 germination protein, Ger(x)C family [Paenibacillus sp. NFR01]